MKKFVLLFFVIVITMFTTMGYGITLGVRVSIAEDRSVVVFTDTRGGVVNSVEYPVSIMARPFIDAETVQLLHESDSGIVAISDTIIYGWSRILKKDIHIKRYLLLKNGRIFLKYDENLKFEKGPYVFIFKIFLIISLFLFIVSFLLRKELFSQKVMMVIVFFATFVNLLLSRFTIFYKTENIMTNFDFLFLILIPILPSELFLIIFPLFRKIFRKK